MRNRDCPKCGSHNIRHRKREGQTVCLNCGYVLEDRTIGPQTGTPSHIRLPAQGGDGRDWCSTCGNYILRRDTPATHHSIFHVLRENSRAKGHHYSRHRESWMCNHCYFSCFSRNEVKAHLEEEHYYILHPEKRPEPEPPLFGHMTFLEKEVWKCCHCDYKNRKNKVVRHLAEAHKLQINSE